MKLLTSVLMVVLASLVLAQSVPSNERFYGHRMAFFRRPKIERVSSSRNLTIEDKQKAKTLGPNVCPDRVFLGSFYHCEIRDKERNCTRKIFYRTVFRCCPGYAQRKGDKGCPVEQYTSTKTIVEVLEDLKLTTLARLVKLSGLKDILEGKGPITVFGPSNEAFAALGQKALNALEKNTGKLRKLLTYHVIHGKIPTGALEDESLIKTLDAPNNVRINVFSHGRVITIQGARVTKANQGAKNGIVHVVNKVLMPSDQSSLELLKKTSKLSRLYKAIVSSGLKLKGPLTIFAPTNEAFEKMKEMPKLESKECLQNLLKYHVIGETVYTTILNKGQMATSKSLEGSRLRIRKNDGRVIVNNVNVTKADISTTDGVVHIIDDVMVPNSALSLSDVAERIGANELVKLLKKSGLEKALSGEKKFTLFAPCDDAIRKLPAEVKDAIANPQVLKDILMYHVVGGRRGSDSFENEQLINTLSFNKSVRVNIYRYGGIVTVQGGRILPGMFDIKACNGYINVIDRVLLPPQGTILHILESDPSFSTFISLLDKAGFKEDLRTANVMTVFAPTNTAFSALPKAAVERLLEDEDKLKNLLGYHLFRGTMFSSGLVDGSDIYSLSGEPVNVQITDSEFKANDAMVTKKDVGATNGVIHVVDAVIQKRSNPMERFLRFLELL